MELALYIVGTIMIEQKGNFPNCCHKVGLSLGVSSEGTPKLSQLEGVFTYFWSYSRCDGHGTPSKYMKAILKSHFR